jgi:alkylation response protein AidB-like acyl-CoA dehydrogenase
VTDLTARPAAVAPDSAELVSRVRELQPLIAGHAAKGEADRRVVEESITVLSDAGIFKIAQPRRYGGFETSMRTMLDVSSAVAEADGGTSWVVTLCNGCAWLASLFAERAQDDAWADNPGAKVSGVLAPTAESVKVDGGFRVTGQWFWNSGSWHADWAVLGIPIERTVAEAAMLIDTAHLHAYRAADDIDRAAADGTRLDVLARARVRADTGRVLESITKAIDILLYAHGAGSFAEANPLQRIWRDSAVGARHAVTLPAVAYEVYGKALLGRDDQPTPLI